MNYMVDEFSLTLPSIYDDSLVSDFTLIIPLYFVVQYGVYQAPSSHTPTLLLQEQTISSLRDLQPFFSKLLHYVPLSAPTHIVMREAETVLDNDIIEPVNWVDESTYLLSCTVSLTTRMYVRMLLVND